jgi:hypothetical protein
MSVDCVMVGSVAVVPPVVVVVVVPLAGAVAVEPAAPEPVDADGAGVEPVVAAVEAPAAPAPLADAAPEGPPDCGGIGPSVLAMSVVIRSMIDRARSLLVV